MYMCLCVYVPTHGYLKYELVISGTETFRGAGVLHIVDALDKIGGVDFAHFAFQVPPFTLIGVARVCFFTIVKVKKKKKTYDLVNYTPGK
jgi:hypothetical protein